MTGHVPGTILVPLDGSMEAERSASFAKALLSAGGVLILLRVIEGWESLEANVRQEDLLEQDIDTIAGENVQQYLNEVSSRLATADHTVRTKVMMGDPAEQIIQAAADEAVTIVAMSTHGRGALGRVLFGSVADRVVHYNIRPTLLLRGGVDIVPVTRIIMPLDGSELAENALPMAIWMARQTGALLHLVRIVDLGEILSEIRREAMQHPGASARTQDDAYEQARIRCESVASAYLTEFARRMQDENVPIDFEIQSGTPAFCLLDLLRSGDVMVMTTRGMGGLKRVWIGSVAEKLIRLAQVPILIVRPETLSAIETLEVSS